MHVIQPPVNRETLHREYLRWAVEKYRKDARETYTVDRGFWSYTDYRVRRIPELLSWLYKKGRDEGRLFCDYLQFERIILDRSDRWYYYTRNDAHWYELHGVDYRERRKKRAAKKEVSDEEIQRREWRKSKSRDCRPWWSGKSRKRWAKKYSNKSHRAWERECIEAERYDDLGKNIRKDMFDPWDWD